MAKKCSKGTKYSQTLGKCRTKCSKGERFLNSIEACKVPCQKGQTRHKKYPYGCYTPKKRARSPCPKGSRRNRKTGRCNRK